MSEEIYTFMYNITETIDTVNFNQSLNDILDYNNISTLPLPPLEACDSWKQYLLTLLYLMTSLFSLIGNIVSIVVLIVGKRSSRELKKYLINLSVSDILMALFSIPFTYTDFMLGRWVLPRMLCPFAQFITIFSLCASVATLTAIAIERYLAIIYPLRLDMWNNYRSVWVMLGIWSLAICLASPQLFTAETIPFRYGNQSYRKCREVTSRRYSTNYSIIVFVVTFLLPFLTLSYVYGSIGIRMFTQQIPGLHSHQPNNSFINKLKAVKISAVVVLLFLICWLPIQIFNLVIWIDPFLIIQFFNFDYDSYMALFFVCHWISSAHSFVNPIIYSFMSANFRKDFRNVFLNCCPNSSKRLSNNSRKISVNNWHSNETTV